jgi:hypothetical protein
LALNEEGIEALGEKYDVQPQSIYDFRLRNKGRIAAVLAEWTNEFSDLHSVKKHNQVAELEYLKATLFERLGELTDVRSGPPRLCARSILMPLQSVFRTGNGGQPPGTLPSWSTRSRRKWASGPCREVVHRLFGQ